MCGGEPMADWTGLEIPEGPTCPYQWRRMSVGRATKGHKAWITGIKTKFKEDDKLEPFLDEVKPHLVKFGMDMITYLPSPSDPTKMISVIRNYFRFTMGKATMARAKLMERYDIYSKQNDLEFGEYISKLSPYVASKCMIPPCCCII